jgi:hypothetical protein
MAAYRDMSDGCGICGASTSWVSYVDEDGFPDSAPEPYCDHCYEIMAERSSKRREWDYYHPGEPCPECELPSLPTTLKERE